MINYRFLSPVLVAILLITAGCMMVPSGDEISITVHPEYEEQPNESLKISGTVSVGGGIPDKDEYRDIYVKLYSEDGTVLCSRRIGDFSHGGRLRANFSIVVIDQPHYITVESPDFFDEKMTVDYFQKEQGSYRPDRAASPEEMPVWNPDETGPECPGGIEGS